VGDNVGENKPQIDFVEVRKRPAPSGGAWSRPCYIFQVDGREVEVKVGYAASGYGKMPREKVQLAAKAFLEMKTDFGGSLPQSLILDAPTMDLIVRRLGWPSISG
jgi:hypothetical protein